MTFTVIIPARYASERLPGKPLLEIAGQTMIERVYRAAASSEAVQVVVATDDRSIFETVAALGAKVLMTRAEHPSGTDRLQEAATALGLKDEDIVVNVQGDEPLMPAAVINQVARVLAQHPKASAATLSEAVVDQDTIFNPNAVKVVCDAQGRALYFSRASIPWVRGHYEHQVHATGTQQVAQRHLGIYAYRVGLLHHFVRWSPSPLESCEKLEQLRIVHYGHQIQVATACQPVPAGIDTHTDLLRVRQLFDSARVGGHYVNTKAAATPADGESK